MATVSPIELLISGYETPEGPCFDRAGNLYFVDWERSAIMRLTPDGQASEWVNTGGIPAGFNATLIVNKKGIIVEQQIIVISDVIDNLEIRALP